MFPHVKSEHSVFSGNVLYIYTHITVIYIMTLKWRPSLLIFLSLTVLTASRSKAYFFRILVSDPC